MKTGCKKVSEPGALIASGIAATALLTRGVYSLAVTDITVDGTLVTAIGGAFVAITYALSMVRKKAVMMEISVDILHRNQELLIKILAAHDIDVPPLLMPPKVERYPGLSKRLNT
jgi:hypothetical protein